MATAPFFWSWPIWAKLSFALTGTLAIVLAIAGLVKLRKMVKIKKLDKKAVADPETANIRLRGRSSDEIPFGAKAMMEDPDVDGVWNSRASTPLQSPVIEPRRSSPSRNPFSRSRRNSSVSSLSQLNSPDDGSPTRPTESRNVPPSNLDGTPASTTPLISRNSPDTSWQYRVPLPFAERESFPRRRSVTIRATSSQDVVVGGSTQCRPQSSSIDISSTRRGRVSTDPTPVTPTQERRGRTLILSGPAIDPTTNERTPTTRRALDRMEAHRKFHAAESGQLQPRLRSMDEKSLSHKYTKSDQITPEHESTRAVSWPITSGEILVDFHSAQKIQKMTSPHVAPCRAAVEIYQPTKPSARTPPSAWTDRTQGMLDEKLEYQVPKKRITIKNDHVVNNAREVYTITTRTDPKDKEITSLLGTQTRRVSEGFEVLPAGFLNSPVPVRDFGYDKDPIQESSNEALRPKKLQKRNRSHSRDSQKSSTERVPITQV